MRVGNLVFVALTVVLLACVGSVVIAAREAAHRGALPALAGAVR